MMRSALVTGASRGIGRAIAERLARDGFTIAVNYARSSVEAEQVVTAIEACGGRAFALQADLGETGDVRRMVRDSVERCGRLDVLVNNAAIDITAPIAELAGADWERVIRTNLTGPFLMARHAAAAMTEGAPRRVAGHIVNIASTASKRAWPNASAYHASKWGLLGLSHALHAELRPRGIKVSAIVAGGMRTPFLLDRFADIDVETLQDPAHVARAVHFVLTQPEETVIPELMVLPMRETSWP